MSVIPYPKIQEINDNEYRVIRNYRAVLPNNDTIEVRVGFVYDGASIPRLFWSLIGSPFTGTHTRAAFIHDALYAAQSYDRKICDWIFLQILQEHGCSWIKRNTLWLAVRIFGGFVWRRHTEESVANARGVVSVIVKEEIKNIDLVHLIPKEVKTKYEIQEESEQAVDIEDVNRSFFICIFLIQKFQLKIKWNSQNEI